MASDGPGKFKEKKSRSSKPYDRPKGIISRVTDSVTGLFSSSWLSGWMAGGEEEDEASDPQQAGTSQVSAQSRVTTQVKTMAPPGESFIFAQPVTARRPFRPIYPEEGELEGNNAHGVNVGASTSSGVRMNLATATSVAIPTTVSTPLTTESPSPVLIGRRHPIISSTPTFTARSKSQLEPRPMSLLSSSTPTGDDGSEFSESSVDTGVDASVIPRPDERDYQREILQLDDESLRSLRDSLAKSAPAPPNTQPASALPTLEETRKRPRDADPDQTSVRAEGSLSNRSLFSEAGDVSLSQPQPSALASKRPRFNVSTYGSPVMFDRSVLSDSSFKMSPFYPGKTMFGGASIYRRGRQQTRAQTARVQVKPKPAQSSDDGGLSQSARRILECLEQMSTPISDAKRIPTPIPGQRGSFLDAGTNYTAAYHRHRPSPRQAGPPTSKPSTPVKVSAPDKLVKKFTIDVNTSAASGNAAPSAGTTTTPLSSNITPRMEPETLRSGEGGTSSHEGGEISDRTTRTLKEDFSSSFSKAVAEATAKFKPASNASLPSFEFAPKPLEATAALASGTKKAGGGKVVVKTKASGRACAKPDEDDEVVEDPKLPAVTLKMTSLPKIDFSTKTPHKVASSSPEGFKFASPEVVLGDKIPSEDATILPLYSHTANLPVFTFSSPAAVGRGNVNHLDSGAAAVVPTVPMLFNSCSSGFSPKLKEVIKKDKTPSVGQLKEGSILDILKPKRTSPEKIPKENNSTVAPLFNSIGGKSATVDTSFTKLHETIPGFGSEQISSTVNSVPKKTESSQVFQGFSSFMKSSDEWECSVCMLRNKITAEKCVACETSKPGLNSNSSDSSSLISNAAEDPPPHAFNSIVGGWGNAFKKSDSEWECEMCMVRNKDSSEKCVACETPKPGSKSEPLLSQGSKVLESKEEKTNIGFGSMFVKAKGEWECATCLVRNKSDASRCVSCETPKPGAAAVSQAITGNFRFGANTHDSSTSSTFKFGLSDSQSEVKSSSGFKFGVSAKNTEESNSKGGSGGFKFGVSEEVKLSALTGVSRDVASDKSKENSSESVSSSFTFGVKKSSDKANETDSSKVPNFSFSAKKLTGSESETANAIKTGFNFKASSQDATFTFGAGLKRKTESHDKNGSSEIKPVSEFKSGSVADVLKESDSTTGTFSFGSKVQKPEGNAAKPPSIFNNALSSLHNDGGSKNIAPAFGGPKVKETAPTAPSLIFGSKAGDAAAKPNSFTFGGEVSKGSDIASPFSFTSPVGKDEAKPASLPSFSFGSKRELSESEEPPKKITFGSCASSTTLTNNVNSKAASLFTFGSKENTLNTGSGFGPPPTSTPAFGAPAPTCNATPNFQFGHNNNNPVPAATAPAPAFGGGAAPPAFSGSAAAFGNNNSSAAAAAFAFGQGSKKNVSAGFDFGQAANQAAFNFAGAGVTAPVFQFGGQKQSDPSAGLFQFGTGPTGVESAPSFGGENPFNTPAPPSGRVVKKARRRKQ